MIVEVDAVSKHHELIAKVDCYYADNSIGRTEFWGISQNHTQVDFEWAIVQLYAFNGNKKREIDANKLKCINWIELNNDIRDTADQQIRELEIDL